MSHETNRDAGTAAGFADSWNRVGSVYSAGQFRDLLAPVEPEAFAGRDILELGFGNGSVLIHFAAVAPRRLVGIELGDTVSQTRSLLEGAPAQSIELHRGDLTRANLGQFDLVYCVGVLHHLADPDAGFAAVLRHTRPGGHFHCRVYAHEGNAPIRLVVEPLRRVASRLPWWLTKYGLALPLVVPFFAYSKAVRLGTRAAPVAPLTDRLPLGAYARWIAERDFPFYHHVAFDQLIARRTRYFTRARVEGWLGHADVEPGSAYANLCNGNTWQFGGRRRDDAGG